MSTVNTTSAIGDRQANGAVGEPPESGSSKPSEFGGSGGFPQTDGVGESVLALIPAPLPPRTMGFFLPFSPAVGKGAGGQMGSR